MTNKPNAITKVLSPNDIGETGAHQAGICVPKGGEVLEFFPDLGNTEKNPRVTLFFADESGKVWKFCFIYYNNKFFDAKGTRNEYRLTGMTAYFREHGLRAGDSITLAHQHNGIDIIRYERNNGPVITETVAADGTKRRKLSIGSNWKVIDY